MAGKVSERGGTVTGTSAAVTGAGAAIDAAGAGMTLSASGLNRLIRSLKEAGYRVIGPTVRESAITLAELNSAADLPSGWGVELAPGGYKLRRRQDEAVFAHAAGPQSWKTFLLPPREPLWTARQGPDGLEFEAGEEPALPMAFIGVRPCDLRAIGIQDLVLGRAPHPGSAYAARREDVFIVAVNCTEPGETCFCSSMGAGPQAGPGYDLVLTELAGHGFLVEAGSPAGAALLATLLARPATDGAAEAAQAAVAAAAAHMGRSMPPGVRDLLARSYAAPQWDDVASRCLSCGNCTMACPTCFCTTVTDTTELDGSHAGRWQLWDSCFDLDFSYLSGAVRSSPASRYRQWLTHKLSTWHDQFGGSGCVGCGRCIVWCPVGIDLTAEVAALRDQDQALRDQDQRPQDGEA